MPADGLAQRAGDERRKQGADVDAHVEDREPAVAAHIPGAVELTHHHADTRFEETRADDDQGETREEADHRPRTGLQRDRRTRRDAEQLRRAKQDVAGGDDPPAEDHRPVGAEEPVGKPAADDRCEVHRPRVEPVEQVGRLLGPAKPGVRIGGAPGEFLARRGDEVEHQQRAHAVVAEPLPHLRDEEHPEPFRLVHRLPLLLASGRFGARRFC